MDAASYKFPRTCRLSSRSVVNEIFEKGRIVREKGIKVYFMANLSDSSRIMIAVPKKIHRKAVTRNLIKRRIREAYRFCRGAGGDMGGLDIILIYVSADVPEVSELKKTINNVLKKIRSLIDADTLPSVPVAD